MIKKNWFSDRAVGTQTSHISTMMSILFIILLRLFSVHVTECTEIQLTTFVYNYDNFGDIFRQGAMDDFNTYKYEDIDTGYVGPHEGGVFMVNGPSYTTTNFYDGYIVDISTTHYCGNESEHAENDIWLYVYYLDEDNESMCQFDTMYICVLYDWHYNNTWTPPTRFNHSDVSIQSMNVEECT